MTSDVEKPELAARPIESRTDASKIARVAPERSDINDWKSFG
jgi:hypothetical protein